MSTKVIVVKPKKSMNAAEASEYLQISLPHLYKHARLGEIPGRKIGQNWRFSKQALEKWLEGGNGYESNQKID